MNIVRAIPAFLLAFGLAFGVTAFVAADDQAGSEAGTSVPRDVGAAKVTSFTTSVEAVDEKNRVVTLKGPAGNAFSVPVSENVRNLEEIKAGDKVDVDYVQSVAIAVSQAEGRPAITETNIASRAEAGEPPGGIALRKVRVVTDVLDVDKDDQSILVRGPLGHVTEVGVRNAEVLDDLEKGDQIDLTYVEGVALSLRATQERG